jgi:hypothetical protein
MVNKSGNRAIVVKSIQHITFLQSYPAASNDGILYLLPLSTSNLAKNEAISKKEAQDLFSIQMSVVSVSL